MAEFRVKRDNIIRQAIHTDPALVEAAAERIHSYIVRERLVEHPSAMEAYQKGGMVAAEINGILAAEFCQDLLAPVVETYENEKARIQGDADLEHSKLLTTHFPRSGRCGFAAYAPISDLHSQPHRSC